MNQIKTPYPERSFGPLPALSTPARQLNPNPRGEGTPRPGANATRVPFPPDRAPLQNGRLNVPNETTAAVDDDDGCCVGWLAS